MKKTMIATVLGLALMPMTFAAQTPAKPADNGQSTTPSTSGSKSGVKKHKNHKKPATKSTGAATTPAPAAAPQK